MTWQTSLEPATMQLDDLQLEDLLVPNDINQSPLNWSELFLRTMHQFIPHAMLPDKKKLSHG